MNSKWNPYKSQLQYINSNNRNIKFKNVNYEGSANVVAALINKPFICDILAIDYFYISNQSLLGLNLTIQFVLVVVF